VSVPGARVHLCGPLRIELDGRRVERALPGRQGRLLFAYLLLERHRGVSRDELVALLWPSLPPPSAGLTLRALLSKLRDALGRTAVSGTSQLRVDLGDEPWIDTEVAAASVDRSDRALAVEAWREAWSAAQVAVSIASQRFLPGEDGDWVEEKRREVEDVRLLGLERLAKAALGVGGSELVSAERAARAIVEAAPYRESGYLLLMRTLAARGDPAEAVRVFDRARTLSLAGRKVNGHCMKPTKENSHNKRCRRPIRLRISYTLTSAATITFQVKRLTAGRKVNGRCVATTKRNRKRRKCTRLINVRGRITRSSAAGTHQFIFSGRIGGQPLGPGTYQLVATPSGGKQKTVTFTLTA
jgi:DNA-binding SARP family transcriptional activator